jgi:hypothetical protein
MKVEGWLFLGCGLFFGVVDIVYWYTSRDPTGTTALALAVGLSNGEIAEQLTISPATAKTHVAHLLTKLDARDRIQLVIIAYQSGLVGC